MDDYEALQVLIIHSIPARILVPFLLDLPLTGKSAEAMDRSADWDFTIATKFLLIAAIYV